MYEVQHIKKAMQSPKIGDFPKEKIKEIVKVAMAKSYADVLYKFDEKELEYTFGELIKLVEYKYYYLGSDEIMIAFRNGVTKKYGEFFGLSFATYEMFLSKYVEQRREVKQTITEPTRLLEAPEIKLDYKEYFEFLYSEWEKTGICKDYNNVLYKHLVAEGKINLSNEEKQELMDIAYSQIEAENSKKALTLEELREFTKVLEDLEAGNLKDKIKSRAMKLAVIDYFRTIKK